MGVEILILCSGNIGRSPLGEVMLRAALARRLGVPATGLAAVGVVVGSAGTAAPDGHPASARGLAYAAELGLDLNEHRARTMTPEMVTRADHIFCMDRSQLRAVTGLVPEAAEKAELAAGEGTEIPDPHHEDDEFFRDVAATIGTAMERRSEALATEIVRGSSR
jgi:protein-tyrosine phosphatase